ncbi:MAG: DUF523 domain-containing protein [Methylococcales bacterium]|nr:DUF523 domain-containing protein [Methylococcales bacterium]MBT7408092.1 DUF523 domain-containing protein [Methylococcales bacterium]
MTTKIPVAISACLMGDSVRYDGKHSFNQLIDTEFSEYFHFVNICPEVEAGMTVPRPPIQVVEFDQIRQVVGREDQSINVTQPILMVAENRASHFIGLCGYIFKSRSPSCGLHDVPIFNDQGDIVGHGAGLFSQRFLEMRSIPHIDEQQLIDADQREKFFMDVKLFSQGTI